MVSLGKKAPFIPSEFLLQTSLTPGEALRNAKSRTWGYDISLVGLSSPEREIIALISLLLKCNEAKSMPMEAVNTKTKMRELLERLRFQEQPFDPFSKWEDIGRHSVGIKEFYPLVKEINDFINQPDEKGFRGNRKSLSRKELMILLEKICNFQKTGGMLISLHDFAYPLASFMKGTTLTKEEFLTEWLHHAPGTVAYLSADGEVLLSLRNRQASDSEFRDKGTEIVAPTEQPNMQQVKKDPGSHEYISLYKKYLRALTSSLSFTRCASKLTRVEKLYSKELEFKINRTNITEVKVAGLSSSYVSQAISNGSLMMFAEANKIANAATEQTKELYVVEEPANTNGELGYAVVKSPKLSEKEALNLGSNEVIEHLLANQTNLVPLILSGEAGMGKTVSLTQFAFQMICKLEDMNNEKNDHKVLSMALPLFVKAKRYTDKELATNPSEIDHKEVANMVYDTLPDLENNMGKDEFISLLTKWNKHKPDHNSELIWFIDGLDECENPSLAESLLRNLQHSKDNMAISPLIISSRPSHYSIIKETIPKFGILEMKASENYYTKDELSRLMPEHLCDAWGITRASGRKLTEIFDEYKKTLIHPLFVGWFCFLIHENKLREIEGGAEHPDISQNNLIAKIIEIGVQSSFKRREARTQLTLIADGNKQFEEILHAFVAVSFQYQIVAPKKIFERLRLLGLANNVNEETQRSLLEDCGILFLSGDKIEWTHRTIPEIIYADYYYNLNSSFLLGPMRVSTPVLNRIAQLRYEEKEFSSYQIAKLRTQHQYLHKSNFNIVVEQIYNGELLRDIQLFQHVGGKIVINEHENSPLYTELGKIYLEAMNTPHRFPMRWAAFAGDGVSILTPGRFNSKGMVEIVLKASNDPFCEDLIIFDYGEVVPHDLCKVKLIQKKTSVRSCFAYYRTLLRTLPKNVDLKHPVWSMHKIAQDFDSIFDIKLANRGLSFGLLEDLNWGFQTNVPDTILGLERRYEDIKEVVEYITKEYVQTAYERLFGRSQMVQSIEHLWDILADARTLRVTGSGEYANAEDVHLLGYLLQLYDFNFNMNISKENFSLDDLYDTENVIVKGLLLMPFVSESLRWHNSRLDKNFNPFAPKPDSEFVNFIENEQSTDERKGLKAFHFVTQYKSNLEEPQPTYLESFFI